LKISLYSRQLSITVDRMNKPTKQKRGFAVMSLEQRTAIARMGGKKVSSGPKGRKFMSRIGKVGGAAIHNAK
jgi:general stress protein YciG